MIDFNGDQFEMFVRDTSPASEPAQPDREPTHRILSLGAGVQSSALYLMCCYGEFGDRTLPTVNAFENECEGMCGI